MFEEHQSTDHIEPAETALAELRAELGPRDWERIECVLSHVVRTHGAALARVLEHARASGVEQSSFYETIGEDPLVAGVLVLHGLHPLSTPERVCRVIAAVCDRLALEPGALVVEDITNGVAHIRVADNVALEPVTHSLASVLRKVISEAAPELEGFELVGVPAPLDD